ncbi:MAG: UbiA-like polyprenyltransferase [Verrucomicrobiota bacterium]
MSAGHLEPTLDAPQAKTWRRAAADALEFIKFSHTVFALPFALVAMLAAAQGLPGGAVIALILVCMVAARTAAMAFNRWVDWDFDRQNPRTAQRSALVTRNTALGLVIVPSLVFVAATWFLNPLCFALSPVALALIFGYSLCKRFTAYTHAVLGLALAAAPMGAWAAVTGSLLDPAPWALAAAVWCWVFGFDLIYALMDTDFDRRVGLHSFPARYGQRATLLLAGTLHTVALGFLAWFGLLIGAGWAYWIAVTVAAVLLVAEHLFTGFAKGDVRLINLVFFYMNALVSLALLLGVLGDLWMP